MTHQRKNIFQIPTTDFSFKKIFGTEHNKRILISFLNCFVSKYTGKIVDVTYLPTEHYGIIDTEKKAVFDLLCKDEEGRQFIIEMQEAARAGFDNLSIDLIYDIAYRSGEMWRQELATALWLPIVHLSCYSLTVEENTLLARRVREGQPYLPEEADTERDFLILREMTAKAGFEQYEISNFAKEGRISRHNHAYWTGEPYLGLGPAAHSYCHPVRQWNVANLKRYVEGMACGRPDREEELLTLDQQYDEYVLLRLRTCEGISLAEMEAKFGAERKAQFLRQLQRVRSDLYRRDGAAVRLTEAGLLFADAVAAV